MHLSIKNYRKLLKTWGFQCKVGLDETGNLPDLVATYSQPDNLILQVLSSLVKYKLKSSQDLPIHTLFCETMLKVTFSMPTPALVPMPAVSVARVFGGGEKPVSKFLPSSLQVCNAALACYSAMCTQCPTGNGIRT